MRGKIAFVANSIGAKLIMESLKERELEVHHFDKSKFDPHLLQGELQLLVYELEGHEVKDLNSIEPLFKRGNLSLFFLAEEIPLEKAIELIRRGAKDVKLLSSPLNLIEESILYALEERKILLEDGFLTQDPRLLKILGALVEVAKTRAPILLVGESGTGKELLARFIHAKSDRSEGPFIAINCAALPESLLESELFGYEKGAFSGAAFRKKGKIELAHQGTLLLDEITEMHLTLQSKLLRVLQEGEVDRLGGYHPIKVDFRLISTTNRDIEREVAEGRFRADLFYRINVITVKIPPLRERKEDVKFLAKFYLEKFSSLYHKPLKDLTSNAWNFLLNYPFPGNVRELRNMIERAVITSTENYIDVSHLTDPLGLDNFEALQNCGLPPTLIGTNLDNKLSEGDIIKPLEEMEREAILKALRLTKGNKSKAADLLGITVRTLRNKLKEYEEKGFIHKF